MASVPEKVLNWLYSVLTSEYSDVNRTYHDAAEALSHYPSLSPRTEIYTYENGASALLLLLSGTLPVTFRGATYGFPVAIWVPYAYPRESPIVYITPSPDMVVRPGQHVSGDGRVYHPYLAQWGKYWDKSTLFDFIAVLRGVFAKEPPVRSKQQQTPYPAPTQQAPPPVPPPPAEWQRTGWSATGVASSPGPSHQAPAPPPKPPKPHEQLHEQPQHNRYSRPPPLPPPQTSQQPQLKQQHREPQDSRYGAPPDWQQQQQHTSNRQGSFDISPATPSSGHQRPQVQVHGYPSRQYGPASPVSPMTPEGQRRALQYPQQAPRVQPPAPLGQPQHYAGPPAGSQEQYGRATPRQQQPYQQRPPGYPPQQYPPYPQHAQTPPHQAQAVKPPIDLLDDSLQVTLPSQTGNQIPLPVPPVPPNPEKDALLRALSQALVSQIRQTVTSNSAAVGPLRAQQAALQSAYARLQSELGELQQLDATLASNEQILKGAMVEADRVMEDAQKRNVPDVDDVLVAPTLVGGQLYTLAAEEKGIADTLFVLGRALDKGRVSADVFVKQTRSLARERFLKKALIKKIAKGMALDDFQMR